MWSFKVRKKVWKGNEPEMADYAEWNYLFDNQLNIAKNHQNQPPFQLKFRNGLLTKT